MTRATICTTPDTVAAALGVRLEVVHVAERRARSPSSIRRSCTGRTIATSTSIAGWSTRPSACAMRARFGAAWNERPVVLTGDTMNEIMADYSPVAYGAREYYGLPRVPVAHCGGSSSAASTAAIARSASSRSMASTRSSHMRCAPTPTATLPGSVPGRADRQAASRVRDFGRSHSPAVYERPKVRAQVGSSDEVGGTLAALVDQGIDAAELERRFSACTSWSPPS